MEYASRRRRRRRQGGGGGGRAVVALIMIAAIVYLVSASAAGTWIAQNVMAPIFEAFGGIGGAESVPDDAQSEQESGEGTDALAVSLTSDKSSKSLDITLPAVSCYMLQMGAYSVEANARSQAEQLKTQGAAGYVMEDAGKYRVLASGYMDEAGAKEVKSRLVSEGMDCTVFAMTTQSATFRVTATQEQIDSVKSGFAALSRAHSALCDEAIAFDRDKKTIADSKDSLSAILQQMQADMAILSTYSGKSEVVEQLMQCCDNYISAFSELTSTTDESMVDFSSKLKYTQLYTTDEYAKLMEGFS
ncbi:MAG: SPOR domain-containing protein [Clostridia bacterium]